MYIGPLQPSGLAAWRSIQVDNPPRKTQNKRRERTASETNRAMETSAFQQQDLLQPLAATQSTGTGAFGVSCGRRYRTNPLARDQITAMVEPTTLAPQKGSLPQPWFPAGIPCSGFRSRGAPSEPKRIRSILS